MSHPDKHDVFITYRRGAGSALAQLVYQYLTRRGYRVFMDVRNLPSGSFDETLRQKVKDASDVIVLVTPNCFERCVNEDDWIRIEIQTALESGCNIVPLRTEDATIPRIEELPKCISRIARHQCVTFKSEYCDASLDRLETMLKAASDAHGRASYGDITVRSSL